MSQMLVGIDVSLRSHHVHFMHGKGHTLADFSVSNDTEGANTLIQKLLKTAKKNQCEHIKIGLEATDQYSWHIAHYLKSELNNHLLKQVDFRHKCLRLKSL